MTKPKHPPPPITWRDGKPHRGEEEHPAYYDLTTRARGGLSELGLLDIEPFAAREYLAKAARQEGRLPYYSLLRKKGIGKLTAKQLCEFFGFAVPTRSPPGRPQHCATCKCFEETD